MLLSSTEKAFKKAQDHSQVTLMSIVPVSQSDPAPFIVTVLTREKMSVTVAQAHAIMQAVTVDVWNNTSKTERIKLLEQYCSPAMKAYAPDGSETTGIEEVLASPPRLRHLG